MKYIRSIIITLIFGALCIPSYVHADTIGFKISVTNIEKTSARINVQSTVDHDIEGTIYIYKGNNYTVVYDYSGPGVKPFPSGAIYPYDVDGLLPGTVFKVEVNAKDAAGTAYIGSTQFTTKSSSQPVQSIEGSSSTSTPPTTTNQNNGSGTITPINQTSAAQGGTAGGGTFTPISQTSAGGPKGSSFQLDVRLKNPLKVSTIQDAIKFFVNTLIKIAIPFLVVFFIWSGLKFVLAQGNPTKVGEAKKMFWYTVIGMLLILGAWTITNAIIGTVNSIVN